MKKSRYIQPDCELILGTTIHMIAATVTIDPNGFAPIVYGGGGDAGDFANEFDVWEDEEEDDDEQMSDHL